MRASQRLRGARSYVSVPGNKGVVSAKPTRAQARAHPLLREVMCVICKYIHVYFIRILTLQFKFNITFCVPPVQFAYYSISMLCQR